MHLADLLIAGSEHCRCVVFSPSERAQMAGMIAPPRSQPAKATPAKATPAKATPAKVALAMSRPRVRLAPSLSHKRGKARLKSPTVPERRT